MMSRKSLCALLFSVTTFAAAPAMADEYEPGPVTILHNWLGGQCSFAPDLDVADCCVQHDMAYQNPSDFPFPGTTPGTEGHRLAADLAFRQCILEKNRFLVAHIYYTGVRAFGWLFYNYN